MKANTNFIESDRRYQVANKRERYQVANKRERYQVANKIGR